MSTEIDVKAKMKEFLKGHQVGADPFTSEYTWMGGVVEYLWIDYVLSKDKPWGVNAFRRRAGINAFFGIFSKENASINFVFSKHQGNDEYTINYEFFTDKIQSVKKNNQEITDKAERAAIFQSLVDEIKMPSPEDVKKAQDSRAKNKIAQDLADRNTRLVGLGLALAILVGTVAVVFTGPIGLIGAAIVLLGTAAVGQYTGLWDTKAQRVSKVEAIFNQEKIDRPTKNTSSSVPAPVTPTESVSQASVPGKGNASDSPSAPLTSSAKDNSPRPK